MKKFILLMVLLLLPSLVFATTAQVRSVIGMAKTQGCTYTDCFDRTNGSLGSNWTTTTSESAPAIDNNQVKGNAAAGRSGAWYNATAYNSNQKACGKIYSPADSGGVAVRIQPSAQTMYSATTNGASLVARKMVGGSFSTLGTYANISSGDTVCISASGSIPTTVTVTVNGSTVGTPSDPSSTITDGAPGVFFFDISTVRVDDFNAENL